MLGTLMSSLTLTASARAAGPSRLMSNSLRTSSHVSDVRGSWSGACALSCCIHWHSSATTWQSANRPDRTKLQDLVSSFSQSLLMLLEYSFRLSPGAGPFEFGSVVDRTKPCPLKRPPLGPPRLRDRATWCDQMERP